MSLGADQHYASSKPILIGSPIHIEDLLFCVFLIGCGYLTVFCLNHFRYLSITRHPSYFDCISLGELCYKVGCLLRAIAHIKLPQLNRPLEESI